MSLALLPLELSLRVINDELIHHLVPLDTSPSVLVAATSSESDTDDEALHSNNSRYDNQTPPCTGRTLHTHTPDGAVVKVKVETADVHHVESRSASVDGRNGSFCSFSLSVTFV